MFENSSKLPSDLSMCNVFCCRFCGEMKFCACEKAAVLMTVEISFEEDLVLARKRLAPLLRGRQVGLVYN